MLTIILLNVVSVIKSDIFLVIPSTYNKWIKVEGVVKKTIIQIAVKFIKKAL